jgi:hypothetical protein
MSPLLLRASNLMSWPDRTHPHSKTEHERRGRKIENSDRAAPYAAGSPNRAIAPAICPQSHVHAYSDRVLSLTFQKCSHANRTLSLSQSEDGLGPQFSSRCDNTSCRSVTHSRMLRHTTDPTTETSAPGQRNEGVSTCDLIRRHRLTDLFSSLPPDSLLHRASWHISTRSIFSSMSV